MTDAAQAHGFSLGRAAWAWGLICATLAAVLTFLRPHENSAVLAGAVTGAVVGTLGIAGLVGWLTWRLRGRPVGGGRIAFGIVAPLVVLGQIGQRIDVAQAQQIYPDLLAVQQAFAQRLGEMSEKETGTVEQVPAQIAELDALFVPLHTQTRGKPAAHLVKAHRENLVMIATQELTYRAHLREFDATQDQDFSGLDSPEALDRRVSAVKRFAAFNRDHLRYFRALPATYVARYESIAGHRDFIEGIKRGMERERARVGDPFERLIARRQDLAEALQARYEALVDDRGQWSIAPDATIAFKSAELTAKHAALTVRVDAASVAVFQAELELASAR